MRRIGIYSLSLPVSAMANGRLGLRGDPFGADTPYGWSEDKAVRAEARVQAGLTERRRRNHPRAARPEASSPIDAGSGTVGIPGT